MNREIKIHNSNIPSKYLRSTSSIDESSIHQFKLIKQDAHDSDKTLTSHPFNRPQAKLYLNCHLNPKIHYPLSSSIISNEQVKKIHKAHIPSVLFAMRYNKTWLRELRFGIHNYCGLQLKHCEVEATIKKFKGIRTLLYKQDTSKAITIMIVWYQIASGITTPVLEYTNHSISYINSVCCLLYTF